MIRMFTSFSIRLRGRSVSRLRSEFFSSGATHEVFNQSSEFVDIDMLQSDPALRDALQAFLPEDAVPTVLERLHAFGLTSGSRQMMRHARHAETNLPVLRQFDAYGRRIDCAEYHDSYHVLMKHGIGSGAAAHGFKYQHKEEGSQVTRAALIYMENQLEPGHCCPIVMTAAALPVLQRCLLAQQQKGISAQFDLTEYIEKIMSQHYDPLDAPIAMKKGATIGMSMTEKQGGSDVRANTTTARPDPSSGGYLLKGHKWFTSAPMCDAFLTLARIADSDAAPSCFLVPRWLPDGSRNHGFQVMRLKQKLADRANASSEVEYRDAWGFLLGMEGKGVKTIIEMVQSTRLDCTLGSAAGARRALQIALNHASQRSAFGNKLMQQPLMRNLLADLCIESEAQTLTAMYMSRCFDNCYRQTAEDDEQQLFRIGVTISKYFVTKRLPQFTYECMEALGGNGFVEDFPMAMLFRQSPLNSIWEGSGNVIALDILRAAEHLPLLLDALRENFESKRRRDHSVMKYLQELEDAVHDVRQNPLSANSQRQARHLADRLGTALMGSVLVRYGDGITADAYIASRMSDQRLSGTPNYGSFMHETNSIDYILQRNMPIFFDAGK